VSSLPYLPSGTVYGALLNFQGEHARWAERMHLAPYLAPPRAPVLYIKTANTFRVSGQPIALPDGAEEVELGATLGLIAGDDGRPCQAALFNDLCLPHDSYHRPAVRHRCADGLLGVGAGVVPLEALGGLAGLAQRRLWLRVQGTLRQTTALDTLVRDAATLWHEVLAFQTLRPGDVLMLGTDVLPHGERVRARAGDTVEVCADDLPSACHRLVSAATTSLQEAKP